MQLQGKHVSAIGLVITAIAAIAGVLYYRQRAARDVVQEGGDALGAFPYFQTAAVPSSITGAGAGSSTGSGVGVDLTAIAGMSSDLQMHVSDNSLQSNWLGTLGQNTQDLIASLTGAGFGTTALNANLTQKAGGGFNYNVTAFPIKGNATGAPTFYMPLNTNQFGLVPDIVGIPLYKSDDYGKDLVGGGLMVGTSYDKDLGGSLVGGGLMVGIPYGKDWGGSLVGGGLMVGTQL